MGSATFFKSRIRPKGQVTIPSEIRSILDLKEGDDLIFHLDEKGRVIVDRARIIPPDQAWFWSEHWQQMEREVQADIDAGNVLEFDNIEDFIEYLDKVEDAKD
jgi:AbrB family looped-hinge helix DNA binding protein